MVIIVEIILAMQQLQNNKLITFKPSKRCQPFNIATIQWLYENAKFESDIARTNDYVQMIWLTKGRGTFRIDLQHFDLADNQLFFIKPCQVYQFESSSELEGYVITFAHSFLELENEEADSTYHSSLFQLFTTANGVRIHEQTVAEVKDIIDKMLNEHVNRHLFREEMLRRYLKILFIYLSRHFDGMLQTTSQTRKVELVQKFMSLVDRKFKTEKTVSGYAALLSITPNYLNEIIKTTTGYSAGYHIRQRIVLEVKRQATYSDTCMKQIGYYLGFNDMAHFSKFFKSATGKNFTDFKREKMLISMISD